jgi:Zn-dependent metalloprotease
MRARFALLAALSSASLAGALVAACSAGDRSAGSAGATSAEATTAEQVASRELAPGGARLGILGPHASVERLALEVDALGMGHVRYEQRFKGLRVQGAEAIVHVRLADEAVEEVTDALVAIRDDLAVAPTLTPAQAALAARLLVGRPAGLAAKTELVVVPGREARRDPNPLLDQEIAPEDGLAYRVNLTGELANGPVNDVVFVDAHTGALVLAYDNVQTAAVSGTAKTMYLGGAVPFMTDSVSATSFRLVDPSRGGMSAVNMAYGMTGGTVFTDADNVWGSGTASDPATAGAEALAAAEITWDFFANTYGRRGIANDGVGSQQRVHYLSSYNNAFWNDACKCMTYGDGDGTKFGPTFAIDVSAHEMTHGVIAMTSKLVYSGESGALNESLADIFGTLAEHYAASRPGVTKAPNYLIGEDIVTPKIAGDFLRSMSNPKADGKSIDHASQNTASLYATTPAINGLHYASGLTNNAFYLLAEGGTNGTSLKRVTGVGRAKAGAIFYRAMTLYMTSTTKFAGARAATLSAAKDLYGASSLEWNAVANAWNACGVGDPGGAVVDAGTITDAGSRTDASITDAGSRTDAAITDAGSRTDASITDAGSRTDAAIADAGSRTDAAIADAGAMRWSGTIAAGGVQYFTTPTLAAGTYAVAMTGTGDADLYVQIGAVPTTTSFACRPYLSSTNETCSLTLTNTNTLNLMVKGVAASSSFTLAVTRS